MAGRIEDYALIGDLESAALVCNDGSIDWFCAPRFDSPACFSALLGNEDNGFWRIAPAGGGRATRQYRHDSLVLESRFSTDKGNVLVIDCMPVKISDGRTRIVRLVKGESGSVDMRMEIGIRFDYGSTVPWVRRKDFGIEAISGPNTLDLEAAVTLENRDFRTVSDFTVKAGDVVPFVLTYHASLAPPSLGEDAEELIDGTEKWWLDWAKNCRSDSPWRDTVVRSLITLKALTHLPSGGVIAAPTTSLPETLGGERNWDYRFCWLRDATFTLYSLLTAGLSEEAEAWRDWLLRVAAGMPSQLKTIYGPTGERMTPEFELDWLSGYENSRPVRVGNQANRQLQLDVFGEIMDVFHVSRRSGLKVSEDAWSLQEQLMNFLESGWRDPDNGIWEVRGPRRHFTHSKVMCWVAVDRAVKAIEEGGVEGPLDKWRALRQTIHDEVCNRGYDAERGAFVQYYGAKSLDSATLMIPLVGFLPPDDPRCVSNLQAIERELMQEGFLLRYTPDEDLEGVRGREGAFLPCTFWLADNYALMGQHDKAADLFERLLSLCNDVGLLSEEYDAEAKRLVGNFPQAFSHVSLVNTAHNLTPRSPAAARASNSPRVSTSDGKG
jgi:GH15 family glucan-1,4-alpha-glucosidase